MHSRYRSFALCGLLGAATLACSDDPVSPRAIDDIRVSASSIIVDVGDTLRLTATVRSPTGTVLPDAPVNWSSLDPAVATVNGTGLVRGVSEGTARILARSSEAVDTFRVAVGGRLSINVNSRSSCSEAALRDVRVVAVSQHAIIAEDLNNPPGGFTQADYRFIATTFDTLVYPVVTAAFGAPHDIDNNQRVVILYTRAVNELTASGSSSFVGGFFFSRDLFPRVARTGFQGCESSNESELFYMLAPDPDGSVNGNRRSRQFVLDRTIGTIGHEFQHLINASRRLYINNAPSLEALWLNEGLSHIAEELLFYDASGLTPKQRIDIAKLRTFSNGITAFNRYAINNFGRLTDYVESPQGESPYGSGDGLATRGATWNFLRYAADRSPQPELSTWRALVNSREAGFANLDRAFNATTRRWVADWAVSLATDRYSVTAEPNFQQQSWNVTSILTELRQPTLNVRTPAPTTTEQFSVIAGGSGYTRFRAPDDAPIAVRIAVGATTADPICTEAPRVLALGEVVQGTLTQLGASCLASAADYVVVTTNLAVAVSSRIDLAVRASGNLAVPSASLEPGAGGPTLQRSRQLLDGGELDRGFEARLRELEQRELEPRLVGRGSRLAGGPNLQTTGTAGDDVVVSIVRIR